MGSNVVDAAFFRHEIPKISAIGLEKPADKDNIAAEHHQSD